MVVVWFVWRQPFQMTDRPTSNPFMPGWLRQHDAAHDFRWFKEMAERDIRKIIADVPNFAALEEYTAFVVFEREGSAVQAGFGARPMGRRTIEGKTAVESGAAIVYSLGPTGDVATLLYPAKSDFARVNEECVHLRIKRQGAQPLYNCLRKDLKYLVAYERVTSLDTSPTLRERLKVAWLRFWNRMQIDGRTKGPRAFERASQAVSFSSARFTGAVFMAILKPLGLLFVAYLLVRFGMPELANRLLP